MVWGGFGDYVDKVLELFWGDDEMMLGWFWDELGMVWGDVEMI